MSTTLDLKGRSLSEHLAALQAQVRQSPGDAKLRTFLFQLLAVLGQWDRALTQLGVAGDLDPGALAMVQTYRDALQAEALRAEVFAGHRTPVVFGEPAPWVALALEALQHGAAGRHERAATLRAEAFEQAPAVHGRIVTTATPAQGDEPPVGEPFECIADSDERLGPMIEAVVLGRYWWIPLERVKRMDVERPTDLRDLVWTPVHFEWVNGGEAWGLVPTRYPGSESVEDDAIRLARRTEWRELAPGAFVGLGQRMFATDTGEYALLDLVRVDLDATDAGA